MTIGRDHILESGKAFWWMYTEYYVLIMAMAKEDDRTLGSKDFII